MHLMRHGRLGAFLAAAMLLLAPDFASARPPMETNQLVDGNGVPIGTAENPLNVVGGGGGGGGATGSVTPAGTNGTAAQAVQGINGGVPLAITGSFLLDTTFTGRINTLGQKAMAQSTPVVLPSDQVVQVGGSVTANLGTLNGAATEAKQPAFGAAGTPSTNVLTVQGIASGTPQPVVATPTSTTGSVTAYTAGTTSAQALAAATRRFLAVVNESTTANISCSFGGTAALNTAGSFTIPAGATRVWDGNFVPSDAVNCIASAASTPVTIQAN